jgi:hypothetical protein
MIWNTFENHRYEGEELKWSHPNLYLTEVFKQLHLLFITEIEKHILGKLKNTELPMHLHAHLNINIIK